MLLRHMAWRAAWGYLALVLLLAPVLGLMHGVVHGAGGHPQAEQTQKPTQTQTQTQAAPTGDHAHGHGWLDDLFSAHGNDSDCRVFDQLCHSQAPPAQALLVLPLALLPFVFHFLEGEVLARWAALFEARGPPLTR
ncbi:hypothetical protein [Polaromonas sp.]|uniref:hypothetical protein n=1 Tax=Polaromonas sp. TaxID=1869339 RepID=UPI002488E9DD|nr:hypothetical protein [Polaromonas sp.]MDI1339263.1 hypothetical protein [Polaromonas sp.]